jgi:long-subunit acyl-CoA synthetase (AMP-forming)
MLSGVEHSVKTIIVLKKVDDISEATKLGLKVLTFDEVVEQVKHFSEISHSAQGKNVPFTPKTPSPDDLATIMYTSGTTGQKFPRNFTKLT